MQLDLSLPSQLIAALTPEIVMLVGAMFLMLWSAWGAESEERQRSVGVAAIGVCVVAAVTVIYFIMSGVTAGSGPIAIDNFRWVADLVFLLATVGTLALAIDNNKRDGIVQGETHVLILFATSGMMFLAAARDLMIIFLGIELMSIAVYVLTGLNRRSKRSAEGAIKYFLLGAFSTGFLLYGIALIYGATAATNLTVIGQRITDVGIAGSPMLLVGLALLLIGFGFKVAAAPFHMWAPDVYEGAPTAITAYMAAAVKAAAFASLLRLWLEAFPSAFINWHGPVWWLAAVTMVVGNLIALLQKNIKRMLAYSSIAHAGYILVSLSVGQGAAGSAFLFYVVAYTLATFGAFGVVSALTRSPDDSGDMIDDYAGLWTVRPGLALAMTVFMLALLGFPIFGGVGFFAKWYIIKAALSSSAPQTRLVVLLVLTSVVSAGYYLYVVMVMFMKPRRDDAPALAPVGGFTRWVIATAAVLILVLGVWPNGLDRLVQAPTTTLRGPAAPGMMPGAPIQPQVVTTTK